jgi:hypothetical protein
LFYSSNSHVCIEDIWVGNIDEEFESNKYITESTLSMRNNEHINEEDKGEKLHETLHFKKHVVDGTLYCNNLEDHDGEKKYGLIERFHRLNFDSSGAISEIASHRKFIVMTNYAHRHIKETNGLNLAPNRHTCFLCRGSNTDICMKDDEYTLLPNASFHLEDRISEDLEVSHSNALC